MNLAMTHTYTCNIGITLDWLVKGRTIAGATVAHPYEREDFVRLCQF